MTDIFDMIHEATLKIARGEVVDLVEASYSANSVAIGHFETAGGWVEKITTRDSMCWKWMGPHPVRVDGVMIKPGECTKEIEMDWS